MKRGCLTFCGRELLAERGVQAAARWSKYKEALAEEPRFQDMPKDDREQAFRDYVAKLEAQPLVPLSCLICQLLSCH